MKNYRIDIYNYTEKGALAGKQESIYRDSVEDAKIIYEEYDKQRYVNEDGTTGYKKYKVEFSYLCYKKSTNPADFFAQFEA